MIVYCSGLYSGPNPSPGVGVARSIRAAHPKIRIIGVDYSSGSTGLSHPVFDDLWIQRPWEELDLARYGGRIKDLLQDGDCWISGLDLECGWLADTLPSVPGRLSPPTSALEAVRKPAIKTARELSLGTPHSIAMTCSDEEITEFCAHHGWKVWLKGPWYQALPVTSWPKLLQVRRQLEETWPGEPLHLQAHVPGNEESVVFAAHEGELLGSRHMKKLQLTEEGKTWAGRIGETEAEMPGLEEKLAAMLRRLSWTGGGELELVRGEVDQAWLLECNPRFPAWVFGITLAGLNLPGELVSAVSGEIPRPNPATANEFVRIVTEVPLNSIYSLTPPAPRALPDSGGKHPSGMPQLARRLAKGKVRNADEFAVPTQLARALKRLPSRLETPSRLDLPEQFTARAAEARTAAENGSDALCRIELAYSIKTQPTASTLQIARKHRFLAEAISGEEATLALELGYQPQQLILNGPAKHWPTLPKCALAVFADSADELGRLVDHINAGSLRARYVGVRFRPPGSDSRFGSALDQVGDLARLVETTRRLPPEQAVAVHFHQAYSEIGKEHWDRNFEAVLIAAAALGRYSDRTVSMLDLGGGWTPPGFDLVLGELAALRQRARDRLPDLRSIILEPGKALMQPSQALITRVLALRRRENGVDAVVDASIGELPQSWVFPHPVYRRERSDWMQLGRGSDRLLGRLCMEADILREDIALPSSLAVEDTLVIGEAGGYDSSMAYDFGRG